MTRAEGGGKQIVGRYLAEAAPLSFNEFAVNEFARLK